MAQYYTDFGEYSTGSLPSDWSEELNTGSSGLTVQAASSGEQGNVLRGDMASGNQVISWDGKGGADLEIVALMRGEDNDTSGQVGLRITTTSSGATGYFCHEWDGVVVDRYDGGNDTNVAFDASGSVDGTSYFWMRLRINGSDVMGKAWQDGNSEPNWQGTGTDSTYSSGSVGLMISVGNTWEFSEVGVGTNGDSAPTSTVGPSAPSAPSNLQLSEQ